MAKSTRLRLIRCLPGFAAQAPALRRELQKRGAIVLSQRNECLRVVRDWIASDESLRAKMEANEITLTSLGEFVGRLASHADLPHRRSASPLVQEALLAAEEDSLVNRTSLGVMASKPGFQAAALETLQELRHYELDPRDLAHSDPRLADLAEISAILESALEKHKLTTLSLRVQQLLEAEPSVPDEIRRVLWIGEDVLEPLWARLIQWLVEAGCTVSYFCEVHPTNAEFFPEPPFPQADADASFPIETIDATDLASSLPQHAVYGRGAPKVEGCEGIQIVATADEFIEVETALRELRDRLQDGAPPQSLVLYVPTLSEYGPLIHSGAIRLRVPIVMDYQIPLLQNPLARALQDLLGALVAGSIHAVSLVMRSPFTRAKPAETGAWEALLQEGLSEAEIWQRLEARVDANLPEWASELAAWQRTAANEIGTASDWIARFRELVALLPWIHGDAFTEAEKRHGSALDTMIRGAEAEAIATLNRKLSFREWTRRVVARWKTQTAYIRVRDRGGLLVTQSVWDVGTPDLLYALGMTEGRIPRKRIEDPLLPDRARLAIPGAPLPTSYEEAYAMQRDFYRLISASPHVILSYPKTFSEGDEVASGYLADLRIALPACRLREIGFDRRLPDPTPEQEPHEQVASAAWNGVEPPAPEAKALLEQLQEETSRCDIVVLSSPNLQQRVSSIPDPLRVDHLRAAEECAFRFLVLAHFRLRTRRHPSAWSVARAAIYKTDLSLPPEEMKEELRRHCKAEIDAARPYLSQEELRLLQLSANTLLDSFVQTEANARERWKVRPKAKRVSLQDTGLRKVFRNGDQAIHLDATIDVLYEVEGFEVPMLFGFVPVETQDGDAFELRAALYAALAPEAVRVAIFHDLSTGLRRAYQVGRAPTGSGFVSYTRGNLYLLPRDKNGFLNGIRERFVRTLDKIAFGTVSPEPGNHCKSCSFEDFCRKEESLLVKSTKSDESA
ncbi:MAG: hypothetical protein D6724_10575 [Armatimonadetes bacterium]|nr:MAG: hypothetical protein D6724_10575 [Armatimonadota bacterium]